MQDDGIVLYHRFLDGDERGLEELIALYQRGLLRFIYGYVHDEGLAQDILQEVFIQLYFKRSFKERKNASLKTYIYKIARNKSLNAIKSVNGKRKFRWTYSPKSMPLPWKTRTGKRQTAIPFLLIFCGNCPPKNRSKNSNASSLYIRLCAV